MPANLSAPALAAVLNHLLNQADWARGKLTPFVGQRFDIRSPPLFALSLTIGAQGQLSAAAVAAAPTATILLPLSAPWLFVQGRQHGLHAVMHATRFEGSPLLVEALSFIARNLRWDIEEDLSHWIGDIAAHRIVRGAGELFRQQRQAGRNLAANFGEYLSEEQPLVASRPAIADFAEDIDRLRDDLARLEKRIEHLSGRR
ncbi:MAG TPA: hypothetical protein VJ001_07195 [Rhodocyclaceae bacterium]|nr:hypothetical protein [Rhodocyclaceae bacterium]